MTDEDVLFREEVQHRRPLTLEEVPLPEGGSFSLHILKPEVREEMRAQQEERRRKILKERIILYSQMKNNPDYRKVVWEKCKRDAAFFIDMFCNTFDDREEAGVVPMVLWEVQIDKIVKPYIRLCETKAPDRCTIGVAKSRAVGFTWLSLQLRVWRWLFYDNWSVLIGSQSRDDVDDGGQAATQQSLFGKLRFILREMPDFLVQDLLGPNWSKEEYNARNRLINPLRPRTLFHGKQMDSKFGRGRRYSEVWCDEVAYCEEMQDADTSLKQTTNRFTFGSTPKGKGNFFYAAMHGALKFIRFYIWWAENPYLDLDWYNAQREQMLDEDVAQELDISFERSAGGRVLHEVTIRDWFTDKARFDRHLSMGVVIDPGWADNYAAVWFQWDEFAGGRIIDFICTNQKTADWIVPFLHGTIPELTYDGQAWPHEYNDREKAIIERHRRWLDETGGYDYVEYIGDDAGNAKNIVTGSSAWDELMKYGIFVQGIRIPNDKEAIRKTNLMMRHFRFADYLEYQRNGPKDRSPTMAEVVTQWRYPKRKHNSTAANDRPVHDLYSHGGDCLKMLSWHLELPDAKNQPVSTGRVVHHSFPDTTEPSTSEAKGHWRS